MFFFEAIPKLVFWLSEIKKGSYMACRHRCEVEKMLKNSKKKIFGNISNNRLFFIALYK